MGDSDASIRIAAERWSRPPPSGRGRWWQHPAIVRHVNRTICGKAVAGTAGGDVELLRQRFPGRRLESAISVGCGHGAKEMTLLAADVVGRFDLFEIAEARIEKGRDLAARRGLAERIEWHHRVVDFADAAGPYDLVYWNNALHHMLDVDAAVAWSRRSLRPGGVLYVNDFVGPTRMQWPDAMIDIASGVRAALPERLLQRPDGRRISTRIVRPDPKRLSAKDPTESADSAAILGAIRRHFADAHIKLTGGVVYHLALNDVLANMADDDELLEPLLALDDACTQLGLTHYAVAVAER
jgi:SAM-dependent methyltransferase